MERELTDKFMTNMVKSAMSTYGINDTVYPLVNTMMESLQIPTSAPAGNEFYVIDSVKYKVYHPKLTNFVLLFYMQISRPQCKSFFVALHLDSDQSWSVDRVKSEDYFNF